MESKKITIAVVGDSRVGKSTFIERHKTGEFIEEYEGVDCFGECSRIIIQTKISCTTNKGPVTLNLVETNSPDIKGVDAYILMFDVTRPETYKSVPNIYSKFTNENAPVVLCGNKVDCHDRKVQCGSITFHREIDRVDYVDLSNKSMYNHNLPLVLIVRKFMGEDTYFLR